MHSEIALAAERAAIELCDKAGLKSGHIVVVGCSTSEISGKKIGTDSGPEIGQIVFDALFDVFSRHGVYLAAQCCEHLNRAIIIDRKAASGQTIVNVIPFPKAGGAFATAAYSKLNDPVALEEIRADAGMDIGGTLIGMHLKKVAVPVRLDTQAIGFASIIAARTRPPLIGGIRANYDSELM